MAGDITPTQTMHAVRQATTFSTATSSLIPTGTFMTTKQITVGGITNAHATVPAQTVDIVIPTCIQTITPDANGYVPPGECGALWAYYPSFIAAVIFAILFGVLTITHVWQAVHYKKVRVNAFAYVVLGRMINLFLPSRSLLHIPAPIFAAGFVFLDIISFIVQLVGGVTASPTTPQEEKLKAIHIYMGGIGMQQIFIVIFVALTIKFQLEVAKVSEKLDHKQRKGIKLLLVALYVSLGMITVRIIYRFVEFSSGSVDNDLTAQEAYFYALEAAPMVIAIGVFGAHHPGSVIDGPGADMPGIWRMLKDMRKSSRRGEKPGSCVDETELPPRYERL
ncbi:hypothetical protein JX265_003679 [Neoarthrinium moseri]|uniref:Uncharacterized protein n=1 Tax=Neoarthrinium moseri TaxID=1658444 RepID=A0A9Q0AT94_9PEZI|nr:uncharacterized protein JN550_002424 [Neoarthrinium moseri]KAI1874995.1 hypothetical protein JN550_002424 [Neoarthrinium moseri]KAI1877671.1 hypothetical protein JX265_003679 [Neoarthrinium moseri]